MLNRSPFAQLFLCNMKTHWREPEAIFWTYGFPLLLVVGLGIAFQTSEQRPVTFDAVEGPAAERVFAALQDHPGFEVNARTASAAFRRLRRNQTPVVVSLTESGAYEYHYDPSNPDAQGARVAIDDALQRAAGRKDPVETHDMTVTAPGSRYVDFLVPGLIGMTLMGAGMWGIGFVLVDMRLKKLLKRLVGAPMRKTHFLLSLVGTRALFFIPESLFLLLAAHLIFKISIQGSLLAVFLVAFTGAMTFSGLGLLVACRAQRIETISGLMNLVMLPMWLCSGIFFSSERFPELMQPFVQALPLTQLINALRAIILEGQALFSQTLSLGILALWACGSFVLALRWLRWK